MCIVLWYVDKHWYPARSGLVWNGVNIEDARGLCKIGYFWMRQHKFIIIIITMALSIESRYLLWMKQLLSGVATHISSLCSWCGFWWCSIWCGDLRKICDVGSSIFKRDRGSYKRSKSMKDMVLNECHIQCISVAGHSGTTETPSLCLNPCEITKHPFRKVHSEHAVEQVPHPSPPPPHFSLMSCIGDKSFLY